LSCINYMKLFFHLIQMWIGTVWNITYKIHIREISSSLQIRLIFASTYWHVALLWNKSVCKEILKHYLCLVCSSRNTTYTFLCILNISILHWISYLTDQIISFISPNALPSRFSFKSVILWKRFWVSLM